MALFSNPIIPKAPHTRGLVGGRNPMTRAMHHNAMAASPTLKATMVNGGRSATATPTKKKDPPHSMDRMISIAHSRAPMVVLIDDAIASSAPCSWM